MREAKAEELHGRLYPHRELYPSAEMWGKFGFTFNDEAAALQKMRELTKP